MKNASHQGDDTRRGTSVPDSCEAQAPLPSFEIVRFERVEFGSKRGQFVVVFPHVEVNADLFLPENRAPFVMPGSVRAKFDGTYKRTSRFSPELQIAILEHALSLYGEEAG